MDSLTIETTIAKVDTSLGLVFGWAIISTENGVQYFDKQEDHIPDESMLAAAADFMQSDRVHKEMHAGGAKGQIVFAWPMTAEIAKAFGITTPKTGLMVAAKPDAATLAKFVSGELTGFSIGGTRVVDEVVS